MQTQGRIPFFLRNFATFDGDKTIFVEVLGETTMLDLTERAAQKLGVTTDDISILFAEYDISSLGTKATIDSLDLCKESSPIIVKKVPIGNAPNVEETLEYFSLKKNPC